MSNDWRKSKRSEGHEDVTNTAVLPVDMASLIALQLVASSTAAHLAWNLRKTTSSPNYHEEGLAKAP